MRRALGSRGAKLIACGIAISTVGFLSQSILTAPRVYYAMARDGVFFKAVGRLSERTRVPVIAIVLQGLWAAIVAITGGYEQILNYVVTIDALFFGLTGAALFVFRRRETGEETEKFVRVPWHPVSTGVFVLACWSLAVTTLIGSPRNAGIGVLILAIGALIYFYWASPRPARQGRRAAASANNIQGLTTALRSAQRADPTIIVSKKTAATLRSPPFVLPW